ncbi:MAG TPA: hypothetical protein VMB05_13590 [Solirubrobacteraceae bacterium]|nr:hypothetical protein [Solirubrobacteraceae bacterium]
MLATALAPAVGQVAGQHADCLRYPGQLEKQGVVLYAQIRDQLRHPPGIGLRCILIRPRRSQGASLAPEPA